MPSARTWTALLGLVAGLALTVVLSWYLDTLFLLLLVPFIPLVGRARRRGEADRPAERVCPECGFRSRDPETAYCPRDGTPLDGHEGE